MARRDAAASFEHLGEAETLVYEVIQELTFLIQELYPMALKEKGLANTLREYIFEWEGQTDIRAELKIEGEQRANLETEQALYRVVQEALANVARHSRASQVSISLICDHQAIAIEIADDGQGFDPAVRPAGMGLRSMRERVEKIHGELRLESAPGHGTHLSIHAPFRR
jgi:NarL family two-component system sensor histidine kinase LiaS